MDCKFYFHGSLRNLINFKTISKCKWNGTVDQTNNDNMLDCCDCIENVHDFLHSSKWNVTLCYQKYRQNKINVVTLADQIIHQLEYPGIMSVKMPVKSRGENFCDFGNYYCSMRNFNFQSGVGINFLRPGSTFYP